MTGRLGRSPRSGPQPDGLQKGFPCTQGESRHGDRMDNIKCPHGRCSRSPPWEQLQPRCPRALLCGLESKGTERQLWGLTGPQDCPRPEPLAPRLCLSLMCELCQETVCCLAPQSTQTV